MPEPARMLVQNMQLHYNTTLTGLSRCNNIHIEKDCRQDILLDWSWDGEVCQLQVVKHYWMKACALERHDWLNLSRTLLGDFNVGNTKLVSRALGLDLLLVIYVRLKIATDLAADFLSEELVLEDRKSWGYIADVVWVFVNCGVMRPANSVALSVGACVIIGCDWSRCGLGDLRERRWCRRAVDALLAADSTPLVGHLWRSTNLLALLGGTLHRLVMYCLAEATKRRGKAAQKSID